MGKFNKKLLRIALALLAISIIILVCVYSLNAYGVYRDLWLLVLSAFDTFAACLVYAALDDDLDDD